MMLTCSKTELLTELTSLSVQTKQKNRDDVEIKLQIKIYLEKLAEYPKDIALHAIRQWTEQNSDDAKWWPSWSELKMSMNEALEDRVLMLRACEGES